MGEVKFLKLSISNKANLKYVLDLLRSYPGVGRRFRLIKEDRYLDVDGSFVGGLGARYGGPFEIRIREQICGEGYEKKFQEVFAHEMGHAVFQHICDIYWFFSFYKLELPPEIFQMMDFVESLAKPGFLRIFHSPLRFFREFVSMEAEELPGNLEIDPRSEKLAELFLFSNRVSNKKIVKEYSRLFSRKNLNQDWSVFIKDKALASKWHKFFDYNHGKIKRG